jgi:hypothetical protein
MNPTLRWIACTMLVIGLIGCAPTPIQPPKDGGKVDARTRSIQSLGRPPRASGSDLAQTPWQLVVKMYVLPRDRNLTPAAAGLDDAEIGHAKQLMWAYNGFRLGSVPTDGLGLFEPLLGRALETNTFTLRNATSYQYIPLTTRGATVDLATSDSIAQQAMEHRRFTHGRFRLLLRVDSPKDVGDLEEPTFTILPQYHRAKLSAVVRSPIEKMLDGTLFNDLGLTFPIQPDRAIVLYAKLPPLPKRVESKPKTPAAQGDPELPGVPVAPSRPTKTARTIRLAEAMLSGNYKKTKRLVQVVLIIQAVRTPTAKPKPAPDAPKRGNDR